MNSIRQKVSWYRDNTAMCTRSKKCEWGQLRHERLTVVTTVPWRWTVSTCNLADMRQWKLSTSALKMRCTVLPVSVTFTSTLTITVTVTVTMTATVTVTVPQGQIGCWLQDKTHGLQLT